MNRCLALCLAATCLFVNACSRSEGQADVHIAVASNFVAAANAIEAQFETETDYDVELIAGSTGALYAQITQGAPYDVFLAADQVRPEKLEEVGQAVVGTRFTYALGKLAIWYPKGGKVTSDSVEPYKVQRFAIANPRLAPYGRAAEDVFSLMTLQTHMQERLVLGENVGQAFAFVKTGNADAGLVALSQLQTLSAGREDTYAVLPQEFYRPIRQDAVLLQHGSEQEAALAFVHFLQSDTARDIITASGYSSP